MTAHRIFQAIAIALMPIALLGNLGGQERSSPKGDVFIVEQRGKTVAYLLNSRDITRNPLRGLGEGLRARADHEYPLLVLVDDRLPIRMLDQALGLVDKVGFANARYFQFGVDRKNMSELSFGHVYPSPDAITSKSPKR